MQYFSEKEKGECPRDQEEINASAWGGICALVKACIEDGSFGVSYPYTCPDGGGPIGTNEKDLWQAVRAEIPDLGEQVPWTPMAEMPSTIEILDLIEFAWRKVGKPLQQDYHPFHTHYHLKFDRETGQAEFRETVNNIFRRNGLVYELTSEGKIKRLGPPGLGELLASPEFNTNDAELDEMLKMARQKFLNPKLNVRREGLEKLWDAWERLKTLGDGNNKKEQISDLLNRAAGSSSPRLREALMKEATELTTIGNSLQIRHSEITQEKLQSSQPVDYLFHRLLSLIILIIRTK